MRKLQHGDRDKQLGNRSDREARFRRIRRPEGPISGTIAAPQDYTPIRAHQDRAGEIALFYISLHKLVHAASDPARGLRFCWRRRERQRCKHRRDNPPSHAASLRPGSKDGRFSSSGCRDVR